MSHQQQHEQQSSSSSSSSHSAERNKLGTRWCCTPMHLVMFISGMIVASIFLNNSSGNLVGGPQQPASSCLSSSSPASSSSSSLSSSPPRGILSSPPPQSSQTRSSSSSALSTFSLRSAFACDAPQTGRCLMKKAVLVQQEPLRIAFVGDSIMFGNGTHAGTRLGAVNEIGVWPLDVIQSLRQRADMCDGSSGLSNRKKHEKAGAGGGGATTFLMFDARNFGIEKVSVTCSFNYITDRPLFKAALRFRPHVVVVGLGTNDCAKLCTNYSKDLFVQRYESIIDSFLQTSKAENNKGVEEQLLDNNKEQRQHHMRSREEAAGAADPRHVVLVTPPPMTTTFFTMGFGFQPKIVAEEIVPAIRDIAMRRGFALVDVFDRWKELLHNKQLERELLLGDGIHPTLAFHLRIAALFDEVLCRR